MGLYPNDDPGEEPWNRAGRYLDRNRSKRSICLDLTHPRGIGAFKRIAANCDVVVENFRNGVMDRLGLGYEDLRQVRPDIIFVSLSSQGASGPERTYGSFGVTLEQTAGLASITGYLEGDPMTTSVLFPDPVVATISVGFVLAALRQRRETGEGCYVDLSQREVTTSILGEMLMDYTMNGRLWEPIGNRDRVHAPQGVYRCEGDDMWVAITVRSDEEWAALANAIGDPNLAHDPRFETVGSGARHHDEADALIGAWTAERDAFEVMLTLQALGIPAGVAQKGSHLLEDPHLAARGFWEITGRRGEESVPLQGRPFKLSRTPGVTRSPAPLLGQHTEEVLREVAAMSDAEIAELAELGVTSNDPRPFADSPVF